MESASTAATVHANLKAISVAEGDSRMRARSNPSVQNVVPIRNMMETGNFTSQIKANMEDTVMSSVRRRCFESLYALIPSIA
jgi:hypothetical protein